MSRPYQTTIVAVAAIGSVAATLTYHIVTTRRLRQNLTEQRLSERRGRIRAEVRLRTLAKREQESKLLAHSTSAAAAPRGTGVTTPEPIPDSNDTTQITPNGNNPPLLLKCIGTVTSPYTKRMGTPRQSTLVPSSRAFLTVTVPLETLSGIESYSHLWIVFSFHANTDPPGSGRTKIRPPRGGGIRVGQLATRSPHRPNPLGLSLVKVERLDVKSKRLHLSGIDLVNGTPVYDVKPAVPWDIPGHPHPERDPLRVPEWVSRDDALARVEFDDKAIQSLELCTNRGNLAPLYTTENDGVDGARRTITEILAQDPRASYRRGTATTAVEDPYKLIFCSVQVEFVVRDEGVTVVGVKGLDLKGAEYVDGIPLAPDGTVSGEGGRF